MRLAGVLVVLSLAVSGAAAAQTTSCFANGPFINCHTTGNNNGGFAQAFRAGQQARRERDQDRHESMVMLYRMAQQLNARVPADATPEQSFALRSEGLDRAHTILTDSGHRIDNWQRVRADLLAHPEMADQALAGLGEPPGPAARPETVVVESVAATTPQRSPEVSARCASLARAWDDAMQRGDTVGARQHQDVYRAQCG